MMHLSVIITLLISATSASPFLRDGGLAKRAAIPPSQDPFYQPPKGYASKPPGTILRSRTVPNPIIGPLGAPYTNLAGAFQILYRTTDSTGHATSTVTTLLVPENADPTKHLSYQVPYDSSDEDCGPSYELQASNSSSGSDVLFINAALYQGWYVSSPDYEGPKGAFTAGPQSGYATLDSIRAVMRSKSFSNISAAAKTAMWGYSGGALASEWAAELMPSYAPKLNIVGASLGGLTPNISSVFASINNGSFAGLAPAGILGLAQDYKNFSSFINAHLVPSKAATFRSALTQCLGQDITTFSNQDINSYFTGTGASIFSNPITASVVAAAGIMGTHGTPTIPIYAYKAIGDEISVVADTDALVAKLCKQGARITYVRDTVGEHATEEITGSGGAFAFVADRLSGTAAPRGCSTQDITLSTLSVEALAFFPQIVIDALLQTLSSQQSAMAQGDHVRAWMARFG